MLTFALLRLLGHLPQDQGVGDDDDEKRKSIHRDQVEQVVRKLVRRRREEVEGHALSEPWEVRVVLHVENHTLQIHMETQRLVNNGLESLMTSAGYGYITGQELRPFGHAHAQYTGVQLRATCLIQNALLFESEQTSNVGSLLHCYGYPNGSAG